MSKLGSEDVREDLLGSFGVTNPRPYQDDEEGLSEEDEQFIAEDENVSYQDEEVVEDESQVIEDETEEEDQPSVLDLMVQERMPPKPEEQSEVDRLKQQLAELEGRLSESIRRSEAAIKEPEKEEEEIDLEGVDWSSNNIAQVFAERFDLDIEDARRMAAISGDIATAITKQTVGKKLEQIEAERKKEREALDRERMMQKTWDNLNSGLAAAETKGELEKQIVNQFRNNKENSLLGAIISEDPKLLFSSKAVERAVLAIARDVEIAEASGRFTKQEAETLNEETVENVTGTKQRARKEDLRQSKSKLSPEDEIRAMIKDAGSSRFNLPEGFR